MSRPALGAAVLTASLVIAAPAGQAVATAVATAAATAPPFFGGLRVRGGWTWLLSAVWTVTGAAGAASQRTRTAWQPRSQAPGRSPTQLNSG